MAASPTTLPTGLHTRGAQVLARFLPQHEEHAPLGFGLGTAASVHRIASHVGDAARLARDDQSEPLDVAVPLTWAAATALAAIPYFRPFDERPTVRVKQELLDSVDRSALERLSQAGDRQAPELVAEVTAQLGDAFSAMAELADDRTVACDGLFSEHEDPIDEFETGERIATALLEMTIAAVVAVELLERAAA